MTYMENLIDDFWEIWSTEIRDGLEASMKGKKSKWRTSKKGFTIYGQVD